MGMNSLSEHDFSEQDEERERVGAFWVVICN